MYLHELLRNYNRKRDWKKPAHRVSWRVFASEENYERLVRLRRIQVKQMRTALRGMARIYVFGGMSMILSRELIDKGFSLVNVVESDLADYINIKKICYAKYVDEYFGGWIDDIQVEKNTRSFNKTNNQSSSMKILLNNETVGFFGYDELSDRIDGITIQMTDKARNNGVGSFYLDHIISISNKDKKPIFLTVFKSNPAQNLYKKYGFKTYDESSSQYMMRYDPRQ